MKKIFVDGKAGTTGLQIAQRLNKMADRFILLELPEEKRKDVSARKEMLNEADFVFLCLPDDAAKEAVSFVKNPDTRIIDASTAHRTNPAWTYGFPELSDEHSEKIAVSKFTANPGCYAIGFISLVYPLVRKGIISADDALYCHAISGYSGAGKKGIEQYRTQNRDTALDSPRSYAHAQNHKHLPEMRYVCGLNYAPSFNPFIADFYSGMTVYVQLQPRLLIQKPNIGQIKSAYEEHYNKNPKTVRFVDKETDFLPANGLCGRDDMEIYAFGNPNSILLAANFDNLGKGAAGSAVQNLILMSGFDK